MKASILVLLVAAFAETKPSEANSVRGLHRGPYGKGGGKGKRKFMMKMLFGGIIDDKCDTLTCPADASSLDCSFERPERPDVDWFGLSRDEKVALKEGAKSKLAGHRERLAMCLCCTDATIEDLLPERLERIEEKVEERCDEEVDCPADPSTLDCTFERPARVDWSSMSFDERVEMKAEKKAEFQANRERMRLCVCCTDATLGELLPSSSSGSEDEFGDFVGPGEDEEVEVAVLLSQANSQEATVETQEAASSASLAIVSFSSAAVLLAFASAMM